MKLEKSLELATLAHQKRQTGVKNTIDEDNNKDLFSKSIADFLEENKIESKHTLENSEKIEFQSADNFYEEDPLSVATITTKNVIEVLESIALRELRASKGYHKKKEVLEVSIKLKQCLL